MYITSKRDREIENKESDYKHFYSHDAMINFLFKNKNYKEREEMHHPYLLNDVLCELHKISYSNNGLEIMKAYSKYINKYTYSYDKFTGKFSFGWIEAICFNCLLDINKNAGCRVETLLDCYIDEFPSPDSVKIWSLSSCTTSDWKFSSFDKF